MISITTVPLTEPQEAALAKLFTSDGFSVLEKILEGKKDATIIKTMQEAIDAGEFDGKLASLKAELREAHKIAVCLEVLLSVKQQNKHEILKAN